ncbi:hypothetical protein X798_07847 [Onchocerca flexuosa]|uniref:Uncharacterized protein n=1 Tax=Onchocerca flexuosa TaxID=387005 RepID=A0A238BIS8_9BILA|nr:hypothetical protein X798_07847 [Onchocerca flexuosa]
MNNMDAIERKNELQMNVIEMSRKIKYFFAKFIIWFSIRNGTRILIAEQLRLHLYLAKSRLGVLHVCCRENLYAAVQIEKRNLVSLQAIVDSIRRSFNQ